MALGKCLTRSFGLLRVVNPFFDGCAVGGFWAIGHARPDGIEVNIGHYLWLKSVHS